MFRKHCENCNRPSFSSCESGVWICPVCNHDLTDYPLFDAATFEKIQQKDIHLKRKAYDHIGTEEVKITQLIGCEKSDSYKF